MIKNIILFTLLNTLYIQNVTSYTTYGFYQGPNKAKSSPQQQSQPSSQQLATPKESILVKTKYITSGFYQGPNKAKPSPQPQSQSQPQSQLLASPKESISVKTKYTTSGFYQGPNK